MTISKAAISLSIALILFSLRAPGDSLRLYHFTHQSKGTHEGGQSHMPFQTQEGGIGMELYPTGSGSSLPDCSHACGGCAPCRRVIISFRKCSVESCPIVYRCMCKGKYYHVPSN